MAKPTFPGGTHPPANKWTAEEPIEALPLPERLVVTMAQSLGAPSVPTVEKGQTVARGEEIGRPDGFISARVHAPTSGTVAGIERVIDGATGREVQAVAIAPDGEDRWADGLDEQRPWQDLSPEVIREAVGEAGVVGLGGATFPTHVKLSPPEGKPIDTILINGAECEPFLTCDDRLMRERPGEIVTGARICMKATEAERAVVCIEDNKPDAVAAMTEACEATDGEVAVRAMATKYPQGGEKQMILAVLGKEVPTGGLPADVGVVVQNVGTAVAITDAVTRRRPLTERVLTASGDAAGEPGNFLVRIGTPVADVLARAGAPDDIEELILGGPMTGKDTFTTDIYVTKGTSGLLAMRRAAVYDHDPCIRCGACVRACPAYLNPSRLSILGESFLDGNDDAVEESLAFGLMDCILCGTCAYVCPATRRIVHLVETLRGERRKQRMREREKERAAAAKIQRDTEGG